MKNMNKVVYVPAHKALIFKRVAKWVSTDNTKTDIFGNRVKEFRSVPVTSTSDCKTNGQRLSKDIQKAVDDLNKKGYEVICISEVISGGHAYSGSGDSGHLYGYSYTEGVNIIAKKLDQTQW